MRNRLAALLVVLLSVVVYWSSLYKPNKVTLPRTLEDWEAHADEFIHPPGKFINLSQASVHYILEGPASADLVRLSSALVFLILMPTHRSRPMHFILSTYTRIQHARCIYRTNV